MKMKKNKIILALILFVCAGISIYSFVQYKNKEKDVAYKIIEAKTKSYENLIELENDSTLIVKGIKTSEDEPTILTDEHGGFLAGYTLSKFKISSIEKNETGNKIDIDNEITIVENEAYDKYKNEVLHIAGYTKMISEKEYLLFLYYAKGNGWYVPCGVTFGKIPFDRNERVSLSKDTSLLDAIFADAHKKYIDK